MRAPRHDFGRHRRALVENLLAMVGLDSPQARQPLAAAEQVLQAAGFSVTTELLPGEPKQVLPALAKAQGAALLVVGSTTTTLLRWSEVPVLVWR